MAAVIAQKFLVCYYTRYSLKTTDAQSDKWNYPYLIHTVTWINIICTEGEGLVLESWYILSAYTAAFLLQSRDYHVSEILALLIFSCSSLLQFLVSQVIYITQVKIIPVYLKI